MASTAAVSVKRAIRDALQAREGLRDVQVMYAWSEAKLRKPDVIFFGVTRIKRRIASMRPSPQQWNEDGVVEVVIVATVKGEQEDADLRVADWSKEVLETIAANSTLGNDPANGISVGNVIVSEGDDGELAPAPTDNGATAWMVVPVSWHARLMNN